MESTRLRDDPFLTGEDVNHGEERAGSAREEEKRAGSGRITQAQYFAVEKRESTKQEGRAQRT